MSPQDNLKLSGFRLSDQDRQRIEEIKSRLELTSSAEVIRLSLRTLAKHLETTPTPQLVDLLSPAPDQPEQG
jgi:hypothetical protein